MVIVCFILLYSYRLLNNISSFTF